MSAFTAGRSASSNVISPAFSGPRCRTFPRDNGTLSGFCVLFRTVVDMPASSWCCICTLRETESPRNASHEPSPPAATLTIFVPAPRRDPMPLVPLALRRDPLEVLVCLASEPGALLLEVPDPERPVTLIGCRPVAELALHPGDRDPLAALGRFVAETPVADPALPFPLAGGVVACLSYELGVEVAPRRITHRSTTPLAVLRRYDPLLVYDRRRTQYALLAQHPAAARARWLERLSGTAPHLEGALGAAPLSAATSAACYHAAVRRILAYLAAGDCYQVNLTQPYAAPL